MADFLFVVPPLTGHTNPTVAIGAELSSRGHSVAWCGFPEVLEPLLPDGAAIIEVADHMPPDLVLAVENESQGLRGAAALKFLFEQFLVPLAHAMVDGVDDAVRERRPDVMVVDQQAFAGALVARRRGVPWATSATTSAELIDPFSLMPKLGDWRDRQLVEFQREHGVPASAARAEALRLSDQLVLAFTTEALVSADHEFPPHFAFLGPATGGRPTSTDFPYDWLDEGQPCVLVSLGTVNAAVGERFFRVAVDALGDRRGQAIIVAPPDLFSGERTPNNVLVRSHVPQLALLPHVDVVVSHGGHNTVCETLAHGVPLVVAPIRDDQPIVADQVVRAGAGIRVKFGRVGPAELADAIDRLLTEPAYRRSAARLAQSFAAAGGTAAAADALEKLAANSGFAALPVD
jgi:MGT family glycosyltransferase